MTTLSTRLAAATSFTDELREECAMLLGWYRLFDGEWWHGVLTPLPDGRLPELHLGEIVAVARKHGLALTVQNRRAHEAYWFGFRCHERHKTFSAKHMDAQLCAMTALAMAIEGEN